MAAAVAPSPRDVELAEYRYLHSFSATLDHFGIKERRLYDALKRCKDAGLTFAAPVPVLAVLRDPCLMPLGECACHKRHEPFDDDLAGDNTSWQCPYTGELFPVVPGVCYQDWKAERQQVYLATRARVHVRRLRSLRLLVQRQNTLRTARAAANAARHAVDSDPARSASAASPAPRVQNRAPGRSTHFSLLAAESAALTASRPIVVKYSPGLLPLVAAAAGRFVCDWPHLSLAVFLGVALILWSF